MTEDSKRDYVESLIPNNPKVENDDDNVVESMDFGFGITGRKYLHRGHNPEAEHNVLDKYQWVFRSEKGIISLVKFSEEYYPNASWEIYAYNDEKLFMDVERYKMRKTAVSRIEELLRMHDA